MTTIFSARPRTAALAFALGLGAAFSFAGPASADPKVLAKVDGQPITEQDVADAMTDIGPGLPQKLEGAARQKYVLDYLIDLKLAAKKAEADKLTSTPEFERKLAYYRDKLAMEQLLGSVAKAATTEEAERKAYDEAAKAEPPQQEIHARHILLPTEDEAKAALARVKGGEDFAKVATELSKDPSGDGGDLGWFTKDRMVPEFSEAAFKLKKGEMSEPIKTQFGWHIIKVEDTRTKSFPPFEQIKDQAARYVAQKAESDAVAQLHSAAKIEFFDADGKPLPPQAQAADPGKEAPAPARPRRQAQDALTRKFWPSRERAGRPAPVVVSETPMAAPAPLSPLAPKTYPALPPIAGVRFATVEAGVRYAGRTDVMLALFDRPAAVAGVFTRSKCPSAPVDWCRAHLARGSARALIVNSGNANAFTGGVGAAAVAHVAEAAAKAIGAPHERNLHGLDRRHRRAARRDAHRPRDRRAGRGGEGRWAPRRRQGDHDHRHLSEDRDRAGQARRRRGRDQRHRQGRGHDRARHGDHAGLRLHRRGRSRPARCRRCCRNRSTARSTRSPSTATPRPPTR